MGLKCWRPAVWPARPCSSKYEPIVCANLQQSDNKPIQRKISQFSFRFSHWQHLWCHSGRPHIYLQSRKIKPRSDFWTIYVLFLGRRVESVQWEIEEWGNQWVTVSRSRHIAKSDAHRLIGSIMAQSAANMIYWMMTNIPSRTAVLVVLQRWILCGICFSYTCNVCTSKESASINSSIGVKFLQPKKNIDAVYFTY